ncbi:hypothetical protein P167DRAFT_214287 [Morchella conica CCBAS932]|uniref:Uncharacterized protein n=1 Tax=Morchella conica CCBAS932 TaxID=1392247 RepID=A0A3N4L0E7_9PEZI|nr:hypothetical protein P167DRAFT_214287 [Morchella conica CCBAS932]
MSSEFVDSILNKLPRPSLFFYSTLYSSVDRCSAVLFCAIQSSPFILSFRSCTVNSFYSLVLLFEPSQTTYFGCLP